MPRQGRGEPADSAGPKLSAGMTLLWLWTQADTFYAGLC